MSTENWLARFHLGALSLCAVLGWIVVDIPRPVFGQIPQGSVPPADTVSETIRVDSSAPAHPFPHFWEQMFGSGRAILSLR